MNEQEKAKKLEEIMGNPEIITSIAAATDTKGRMVIFESFGLPLSEEEVNAFSKLMDATEDQELNESELMAVSGGAIHPELAKWILKTAATAAWNNLKKSCKSAWETGRMAAGKR